MYALIVFKYIILTVLLILRYISKQILIIWLPVASCESGRFVLKQIFLIFQRVI